MKTLNFHFLREPVLTAAVALIILGCVSETPTSLGNAQGNGQNFCQAVQTLEKQIRENPCGFLRVQKPLLEATGFFTAVPRENSSLYLFIAPNTSFDASLFVVEQCPFIYRSSLKSVSRFTLPTLPAGDYVLMLAGDSFDDAQGFPVVDEINDSKGALEMAFYGGSSQYSLATFSIRPRETVPQEQDDPLRGKE